MNRKLLLLLVVFLSTAVFSYALTGNISVNGDGNKNLTLSSSNTDELPGNQTTSALQGTYYIGAAGTAPGGTDPHFLSFRAALDTINASSITGDCIFYITSNITETYADSRGIGLAIDPGSFTITFKPYTGVQPVITFNYPTDLNGGPSGAFVIGIPGNGNVAWDSMRATRNIIIDGSNTPGGTTRDLTLQSDTLAQRNAMPLVIVGDVANVIVKNTNIYYKVKTVSTSGNLFIGAVMIRHRNYLGVDWVPHDILFQNNHLSSNFDGVAQNAQGYGVYQSGTPLPADYPSAITLSKNLIEGKRRSVALYRAGSHILDGNTFVLNQNVVANTTNEAVLAVDVDTNSIVFLTNNKFSKVSSMTNGTNVGNTALSIETFGTYYVFNNFFYGFELTAANPVAYMRGIKNSSPNATLYALHNSIYMNDIPAGGTVAYNGMYISDGANTIANNIVYNAIVDFPAYCISRIGALGTLASDYNDFYYSDATNGNVGFWDLAATQTLAAWRTASSQDSNSVSKAVTFTSLTDLHLTGSSNGDADLAGAPLAGVVIDIDGDTRSTLKPYMGADEASISLEPPASTVLFTENFDYPVGSLLTANGWTAHSAGGTNAQTVVTPGLSYTGYELSGIGNSSRFFTTGEDVNKNYDSVTTGSVYAFLMARFDTVSTTKDYFFHLGPKTLGSTFRGRLFARADASGALSFGVSKGTTVDTIINWTPYSYATNATYLFAMKYTFVEGANNDIVSLFVNPVLNGVEPTANVVHVDANITDATDIGSVAIRQGSSSARLYGGIDGIQIRTNWPLVIPVELTSFTASTSGNTVQLAWTTATETNNSGFSVERKSTDGNWSTVAFVDGKGTTTAPASYIYTDRNLSSGTYTYRLKQIDFDGSYTYSDEVMTDLTAPAEFMLSQNYPNPFNPTTTIKFGIPADARVKLELYAITGEKVATLIDGEMTAGYHQYLLNGSNLSTGVYLYRLTAGEFSSVKKLMLVK
ncbi:MAG: hypothetical protein AMXMBFR48_27290 [Ignavibacteriales bacterium]